MYILDQYYQDDQGQGQPSANHPNQQQQQHNSPSQQQQQQYSHQDYNSTPPTNNALKLKTEYLSPTKQTFAPSEFISPPPAHQDQALALTTGTDRLALNSSPFRSTAGGPQGTATMIYRSNRVKDESPVLDMSGWGSTAQSVAMASPRGPSAQTPHYTSYRGTSNLHAVHSHQLQLSPPHLPSSLMPPLNLDANEALKAERKRARNRVAASKCRMRKMEKIATLDNQASGLRKVRIMNSFISFKLLIQ